MKIFPLSILSLVCRAIAFGVGGSILAAGSIVIVHYEGYSHLPNRSRVRHRRVAIPKFLMDYALTFRLLCEASSGSRACGPGKPNTRAYKASVRAVMTLRLNSA